MSTIRLIKMLLPIICLFNFPGITMAQTEPDSTETTADAGPSIELVFLESNNRSKILTATVKTKVEDTYIGMKNASVQFYETEASPEHLLGTVPTNDNGVAVFMIPLDKMPATSEYTFVAEVDDTQEEITATEAEMEMTLQQEDSTRQVIVLLQSKDASGKLVPVAETEIHFYVQRMFGLLPLSENPETTDENGEVTLDFPEGIPGDTAGNLVIVAKVEEHELFGNLDFRKKINWGTQLVIDPNRDFRQLWSSRANAPLYLIFFVNAMLIGIWGVIFYVVLQIFKIKKAGSKNIS